MSVHGRLQGGGGYFLLLGHLNLLKLHRKYSIFDSYRKNFQALRTAAPSGRFVRFCPFYRLDRVWGYLWVCLLALVTITGETQTGQTPTPIVVYCIITIVTCFMYSETNTLSRFPCVKLWSCNFMLENKTNY